MKITRDHLKIAPPDGGWGWLIVLGSSLIYFSTRAIEPSFGLLFGDLFKQLGVETTGASLVVSTLCIIISISGLVVGPLIKRYTYRKVAISGGVISTAAYLLTVPANSMLHILITFGVLGGVGFGLCTACTLVGINDYFLKKKGQAVGLSFAGTTVGFMVMPQIVGYLLDEYGFRSAVLIIGALSLHATVGACLFQPVSWHKKAVVQGAEEESYTFLRPDKIGMKDDSSTPMETTSGVRLNVSCPNLDSRRNSLSISSQIFYFSLLDVAGCSFHVQGITGEGLEKIAVGSNIKETHIKDNSKQNLKKSVKSHLSRLSKFLDLDLLTDGVFLNILYGLSMLSVVEMNIKLILPFFFTDIGLTNSEIASILSSMAASDICSRLIVPPILDRMTIPRRATYLFGAVCIALGRSCLTLLTTFGSIITTVVVIGFFRGISITSHPLVLTEYSSGDNFPSVLGLSMVFSGIFTAIFGPLSGYIRDFTNSYALFIHFQTLVTASVLITWVLEIIILKFKNKKQANVDTLQTETGDKIPITKA
ncbi:monocarboxylate transporter 12 isoform X1 [Halyomorpha halys]|uniref:monocarboxylate transporter 12 isoform X1 n=1 Tax=Halyomorpha halys TaxID=286706 RepID=UPI0006D4E764|nr:monocarboxylate transporter 12-B-like isoform X1 [Halyomorpha halys]